jgi:DNA repair exonuclease SbcCD nuclease subunit
MKVALTADLHLSTQANHPARYHALENILSQMIAEGLKTLVVAGDLFDLSLQNYAEFEALCKQPEYEGVEFYLLPGNHDHALQEAAIAADNVHVQNEPSLVRLDPQGPPFLFLPYQEGITMGELIQPFHPDLIPDRWVLVGHGDWSEGITEPNPYEPGVYMPLTSKDLRSYQPAQAFLGHIHKPFDHDRIHYAGSPMGLNITETGLRRFLLYDTQSGKVESRPVDTDIIYFDEHFVVVPTEDEVAYIKEAVEARIRGWGISEPQHEKVQVRVRAGGYCADRRGLLRALETAFEGYAFYKGEAPDISGVSQAEDPELSYIAERLEARLAELDWPSGSDEPTPEEILLAALKVIYGDPQ